MKNTTLKGKTLGILTIAAYGLSFLIGRENVIGSALSLLGLLLLVFTIIAFVREWRQKRSHSVNEFTPQTEHAYNFLDQYPAWAVQHSTQLVQELKTSKEEVEKYWADLIQENKKIEKILIDCLAGAHVAYLSFESPEPAQILFGGDENMARAASKLPSQSQNFFMLVSESYKKLFKDQKHSDLASSFETLFGTDKKLDPLAVHISGAINHEVEESGEATPGALDIAGLYRVVFKLQDEQLEWISNELLESRGYEAKENS